MNSRLRALIFGTLAYAPIATLSAGPDAFAQEDAPAAEAPAPAEEAPPPPPPALTAVLEPLTSDRIFRDADVAMEVVNARTGELAYAWNAETALNPASTMKVVTAAVALRELGPHYRWTTTALTDGELSPDGVLDGDLYIQGTGDPTFVVEKLWKMVYDLKLEGIEVITGDVYFDDTFMEGGSIPGWNKPQDVENGPAYFATLGALSLNFNTAAVVVAPGPKVGGPARVSIETPAPGVVEIAGEVTTRGKGGRRYLRMERQVSGDNVTFQVDGYMPQGADVRRYYRSVPDATAHFTAAFAHQMKEQGIRVKGHYLEGETPTDADPLVMVRSPQLAKVLMDTNKNSNNFMAEQVLRTVAAEVTGETGTTEAGAQIISDYLAELGVPEDETALVNGSGLSRQLYLRPGHVNRVLVDMANDPQVGWEFRSSLAIAGRDGTLWARFRDEDEVGRLRGKTGTLNHVHCLTGYVEGGDGETYAFTYLVNDIQTSIARARRAHDELIDTLMGLEAAVAEEGG